MNVSLETLVKGFKVNSSQDNYLSLILKISEIMDDENELIYLPCVQMGEGLDLKIANGENKKRYLVGVVNPKNQVIVGEMSFYPVTIKEAFNIVLEEKLDGLVLDPSEKTDEAIIPTEYIKNLLSGGITKKEDK